LKLGKYCKQKRKKRRAKKRQSTCKPTKKIKFKRRCRRNRHHIKPKSRGGKATMQNLLLFDVAKHQEWHVMFGLMTIDEVIELLTRVSRAKRHQTKGD